MDRVYLFQKKFGAFCVVDTKISSKNCIKQIVYIIPLKNRESGLVDNDFQDIMVSKQHFILSLENSDIQNSLKILGSDINIKFSDLKKATEVDKNSLYNIITSNQGKINKKQIEFKTDIDILYKASLHGNIHQFNTTIGLLKRKGFKFNNDTLEKLKIKCFSDL